MRGRMSATQRLNLRESDGAIDFGFPFAKHVKVRTVQYRNVHWRTDFHGPIMGPTHY